jgi:hypothetical protein
MSFRRSCEAAGDALCRAPNAKPSPGGVGAGCRELRPDDVRLSGHLRKDRRDDIKYDSGVIWH